MTFLSHYTSHWWHQTWDIWELCCQKQVSQAGISNYIPQFTVGCNYLSLPEIPASGNKVHICTCIFLTVLKRESALSTGCWQSLWRSGRSCVIQWPLRTFDPISTLSKFCATSRDLKWSLNEATWSLNLLWRLKSQTSRLFTQPFIQAQIKENIRAPRHWSLWGELTGDRWIPRTKGQ